MVLSDHKAVSELKKINFSADSSGITFAIVLRI